MKINGKFLAASAIAAVLTVTPFKQMFAQKSSPAPQSVPTSVSYAKNDGNIKPSAIFASNSATHDTAKAKVGSSGIREAEDLAQEYSKDGKGIGLVVYKGKVDKDLPDTAIVNKYENYFAKHQVKGKVFIEKTDFAGSGFVVFMIGHDFYGTMDFEKLKKNMPDIIKSQQGFDLKRADQASISPTGMQ